MNQTILENVTSLNHNATSGASTILMSSNASSSPSISDHSTNSSSPSSDSNMMFHWTALTVVWAVSVFVLAGFAEIIGGWLVWAAIRGNAAKNNKEKKPWWFCLIGAFVLITYGFIPCLQPTNSFGRVYAVYGGFFIVLSFLLGWALDGDKPDRGDLIGAIIALAGVGVVMFWPR